MTEHDPLGAVRKVREESRDVATRSLAARLREVEPIERDVHELETALDVLRLEASDVRSVLYETAEGGCIEVAEIERRRAALDYLERRLAGLRAQIRDREQQLELARGRVTKAREELDDAARACQVIQRLDERWQAQRRLEVKRTEERALGEVSAAAWIAARRECRELERPGRGQGSRWTGEEKR